jgi:hypothetical protein
MYRPPGGIWVPLEAMAWAFSIEVDNGIVTKSNTWAEIGYFTRTVEEPHWDGIWVASGPGFVLLY